MKQVMAERLIFLDPSEIIPPRSGRGDCDRYRLFLLSESIRENGLLIPVIVCRTEYGYEVISGEKRIKASILAGLKRIPCIVSSFDGDPELFRAAECLLGHQRDALDDADVIKELCLKHSPSSVAPFLSFTTGELSKIVEITSLSSEIREKARECHMSLFQLSELYRKSKEEKAEFFDEVEAKTERQAICETKQEKKLPPIKDARFLINSVKQLTESLSSAGIPVSFKQKDSEALVEIRIRIEKDKRSPQMSLF